MELSPYLALGEGKGLTEQPEGCKVCLTTRRRDMRDTTGF